MRCAIFVGPRGQACAVPAFVGPARRRVCARLRWAPRSGVRVPGLRWTRGQACAVRLGAVTVQ
jgi:hypothetical protein